MLPMPRCTARAATGCAPAPNRGPDLAVFQLMQYQANDEARVAWPGRDRRRAITAPQVIAVEADDPILLLDGDGAGDDTDRRDAQRPTFSCEVVLVADESD